MGDFLVANGARLVGMAVLVLLSAFFSGSETALFSLSRDRLRRFRSGTSHLEHVAAQLVSRPRALLVTLLFGNMLVNVMFFALSSALVWDIGRRAATPWAEGAAGLGVLLVVIVFGEVAPKTIAATAPVGLARVASFPLALLGGLLKPITWTLDRVVIEPATRLMTGRRSGQGERGLHVTAEELQAIVELAADEGVVGRDESGMIGEVLRIHATKVREVMVPRVDMVACDVATPTAEVLDVFRRTRHKRLVVYRDSADEVVGLVTARRAFLDPGRPLASLLEPVRFVPEQQTVERLLRMFRENKIQLAVVVDEYGGTAGLVTLEDCLEEIVGDIRDEHDARATAVERLSDREFLLAGDLSIRAWSEYVRAELGAETRVDTLGGFVMGLLGRIPTEGDSCRWGNVRFTVREVSRRPYGAPGRPLKVLVEILDSWSDTDEPGVGESAGKGGEG